MKQLGTKIAARRRSLGITQIEFAEKMLVTRQTVSRWEAGSVLPDIDKITEIAQLLDVSCDYLLKDEVQCEDDSPSITSGFISPLVQNLIGKRVKLEIADLDYNIELIDKPCVIQDYEGNWIKVTVEQKKGSVEKLIPLSSVLSFEILEDK